MKVIGVVGLPASGKGEFSKIAERLGIPVVVMGDVVRNAVKKAGLTPTDGNLGAMANRPPRRTRHGCDRHSLRGYHTGSTTPPSSSSTASGAMLKSGSSGTISRVSDS